MEEFSRICADIDLEAVDHNIRLMSGRLEDGAAICAVVKADAYGHGAVPVARHIEENPSIWGFACATPEEAVRLRNSRIRKPILILGYSFPESYGDIIRNGIRACVFDEVSARLLSEEAQKLNTAAVVHIAVDTGMSRIGFDLSERTVESVLRISRLPMLEMEGIFSHFARSDEASLDPARVQLARFHDIVERLSAAGISFPYQHIANSAGIMRFPESHFNMVRAGIILYGLMPSSESAGDMTGLKPVLRLHSHVTYVKTIPEGTPVGYGGTFTAGRRMRIATIPVGYADGFPRSLSNCGMVLVHGRRSRIVGRVCMDQMMIDVSDIPDVSPGDEVILIGEQGSERLTAEELGEMSGKFSYELVSGLSMRVPRRYLCRGEEVERIHYLRRLRE